MFGRWEPAGGAGRAKTQQQKEEHADMCVKNLDIRFPTLVDRTDNRVELAYAGWPDRLYLIGKDGQGTCFGLSG